MHDIGGAIGPGIEPGKPLHRAWNGATIGVKCFGRDRRIRRAVGAGPRALKRQGAARNGHIKKFTIAKIAICVAADPDEVDLTLKTAAFNL